MMTAGLLASALCGTLAGMAGLSLAMPRHHRQCYPGQGAPPPRRQTLLWWGSWAVLAMALALCAHFAGTGTGLVYWFGFLTTAAICVVLLLSYAPARLPVVAGSALLLALVVPVLARFV
ncbi:DUF3325 domain-containing protein [Aquisalimonas asiatica]|uniref:DUF3325 domain-containing protein n=1 Tax=Aquisalimonas asiatica TaxID=406100 RepID=A0A1H8SY81_9GAMM|nr:DUF3325 domain-containing protein [Aquisalimonas asiatica]SEO83730.1 Protein of unknown function [Aquisalimonas asiatica]